MMSKDFAGEWALGVHSDQDKGIGASYVVYQ